MRQKTIIAIWGSSNQGKSETVRAIFTELQRQFPNSSINTLISGGDIKVIITIGKISIGLESQGDPGSRLQQSLNDFVAYPCQIIICSTRTSGSTVWSVDNTAAANGYRVIWATNYRTAASHTAFNQLSAEQIVELIKSVIAGTI